MPEDLPPEHHPEIDPDDDPTKIPEGVPVVKAADSDDGEADQGAPPLTAEVLADLCAITEAGD